MKLTLVVGREPSPVLVDVAADLSPAREGVPVELVLSAFHVTEPSPFDVRGRLVLILS